MEVLRTRQLTKRKFLNLFEATWKNGKRKGKWIFASRKEKPQYNTGKADAVIICAIVREAGQPTKLCVIREFRVPLYDYEYAFPAGLVEANEPIEAAAARELREEAALELTSVLHVSPALYSSAGMSNECGVILVCEAKRIENAEQQLESSEEIQVILMDRYEIEQLLCSQCKMSARLWPFLFMFTHYGIFGDDDGEEARSQNGNHSDSQVAGADQG